MATAAIDVVGAAEPSGPSDGQTGHGRGRSRECMLLGRVGRARVLRGVAPLAGRVKS